MRLINDLIIMEYNESIIIENLSNQGYQNVSPQNNKDPKKSSWKKNYQVMKKMMKQTCNVNK